ncbi:MAG: hypothetical protein ACYC3L_08755 [Gemmatimonadaceae bacterium]
MRIPPPRSASAFVVSIILHVVIGGALLRVVMMPNAFALLLGERWLPVKVEKVGFLALPRLPEQPHEAPRAGGDNRPDLGKASAKPLPALVAPSATPTALPPAPSKPAPAAEGGSGDMVGGGGPTRGVRPSYTDPRLWLPSGPVVSAPAQPRTRAESLHSLLADRINQLNDSLAIANPSQRAPGDWTFTGKDGRKYGIDQKYIRLGKFSIPTAILGMLPLNVQANPVAMERQRTMNEMSREIAEQASRVSRDDDFRAAVRALRERKDKERREAAEKAKAAAPSAKPLG